MQHRIGKRFWPNSLMMQVSVGVSDAHACFTTQSLTSGPLPHGDDYVSSGSKASLDWLQGKLKEAYDIKTQIVGPGEGAVREGKVLNMVLRCTDIGWELEADPRQCELITEQLEVCKLKGLSSPGTEDDDKDNDDDNQLLDGSDVTLFRGIAARSNYLAMDRPDIQYSSTEICKEMGKPTRGSLKGDWSILRDIW